MFAVIKTGGKQLSVKENEVVRVEKLEAELGSSVKLDQVLAINDGGTTIFGAPIVAGAIVEATVMEQMRDRKIIVFKKTRRHNYRRKKGHRQALTVLKITKISVGQ